MIPRCCTSSSNSSFSRYSVDESWDRRNIHPLRVTNHQYRRRRRPTWYTNRDDGVSTMGNHDNHCHRVASSRSTVYTFAAAAALMLHVISGDQFLLTTVSGYSTPLYRPSSLSHHPATQHNTKNYHWRRSGGSSFRERSTRRFVLTTPEAIIEQASTTKLLDDLIDESVRTSARRPLMMQFDPSSGWIWKRWKGTVFSETWDACVYRMIYACIVFLICKSFPQTKELLSGFAILWGQLLSVTTFTLTFFVNQSYALWRKCSELSRSLQGRLHDMDMTLAAHATRMPSKNAGETSRYTSESKQILEVVSRYVRLFNLLTYASFTRSHRPVLTPRGMRRLVERGLMTPLEREVLVNAKLPATQRHNAVLLWILRTFIEGTKAGHFTGGAGFEQQFIEKAHVCRSAYGAIGDELQGRMPLAYAHIVQVLVDLVLALYPFMAYSAGMSGFVCVIGTGLLTIGYQGLVWFSTINIMRSYEVENFSSPIKLANYLYQADLAKQFLDPYDNENYGKGEDPLVVDTLIAETNAGSTRWMDGLAEMPVAAQKIIDGELSEYILPRRGYTVEELQQMLEEQKLLKEKRDREELERQKKKEQEDREKAWAEAMIPGLMDTNSTFFDANTFVILDGINERVEIPDTLLTSSISIAETVNTLTFSQNSNATSLQESLVPEGTVPVISFNVKKKAASVATVPEKVDIEVKKSENVKLHVVKNATVISHHATTSSTVNSTMEHIESPEPVQPPSLVQNHTITVPNISPVPTDLLLQEVSVETYPPNTIEYYQQKIQEILDARREEDIRLTRTVVMAQSGDEILDDDESELLDEAGLGPQSVDDFDGELVECIPTSEYQTIEEILEAAKQEQWETQAILNARPGADTIAVLEEEEDLISMAVNATDAPECLIITKETLPRQNTTEFTSSGDVILDAEQITTESTAPTAVIDDVLVELLETEAILNAPPGANSIEVRDEGVQEFLRMTNSTDDADDLSVLQMDDLDVDTIDELMANIPDLTMPEIDADLNNHIDPIETSDEPIVSEGDGSRLGRR